VLEVGTPPRGVVEAAEAAEHFVQPLIGITLDAIPTVFKLPDVGSQFVLAVDLRLQSAPSHADSPDVGEEPCPLIAPDVVPDEQGCKAAPDLSPLLIVDVLVTVADVVQSVVEQAIAEDLRVGWETASSFVV
jgi:hypothetical protein